jgi:hypothetical protein
MHPVKCCKICLGLVTIPRQAEGCRRNPLEGREAELRKGLARDKLWAARSGLLDCYNPLARWII